MAESMSVPNRTRRGRGGLAQLSLGNLTLRGYSLAGEESFVIVPELDVVFDMGRAHRHTIGMSNVLLTHGHMDHAAGIAYYFSQRNFQGNVPGTLLLPAPLAPGVNELMRAWIKIEGGRTPYKLVPMRPGDQHQLRNNLYAHALKVRHVGPSLAYAIVEQRNKLKEEYTQLSGQELVELKKQSIEISYRIEVPLVCYLGDTARCDVFENEYVRKSRVLVGECTFVEPDHRTRAAAGKHMHLEDWMGLLDTLENEHIVFTHLSRRTEMEAAKQYFSERLDDQQLGRLHFLMDRQK